MKRTALAIVLLMVIAVLPAFSFGIGAAFGLDVGGSTVGPGALLSFRLDSYPAVFGAGVSFSSSSFSLGVTADWWLYHADLVSILSFYVGPGLYLDLAINSGNAGLGAGLRVPVGLQAWVLDPLEVFFELAPTFGLKGGRFPAVGMQGALGFRFWL